MDSVEDLPEEEKAVKKTPPRRKRKPRDPMTDIGLLVEDVWVIYKENGGKFHRDTLLKYYLPLVRNTASKISMGLPANVEVNDLISMGSIGLMDAIEKYQLDRNVKFETYAVTRIHGEIWDQLRNNDWVPRSVRSKIKRVEEATRYLETLHKRKPTEQEIREHLELTPQEMKNILAFMSRVQLAPLEEIINSGSELNGFEYRRGDTLVDARIPLPGEGIENEEIKQTIKSAVNQLDERGKMVIALYYFENLTLQEIGRALGVTESRVCQLHNKALENLKKHLPEKSSL